MLNSIPSFNWRRVIALIVLLTSASLAQWSSNPNVNTPVVTATSTQNLIGAVTDGDKGAIALWRDLRNGTWDLYVQRLNGSGTAMWTADGVRLTSTVTDELSPKIISDGSGGAIIVWQDLRTDNDIYAQRVDGNGNILWTAGGLGVCTVSNNQTSPDVTLVTGGLIVAWTDQRVGGANSREVAIYAQKLDLSGSALWTAGGVQVIDQPQAQYNPKLAHDGSGGAYVFMDDESNSYTYRVTMRIIDLNGTPQGSASGTQVVFTPTGAMQLLEQVVLDPSGTVIVTWRDFRMGGQLYYGQKFSGSSIAWALQGVQLSTEQGFSNFTAVSDQSGGIFVTYPVLGNIFKIQRFVSLGTALWAPGGVDLNTPAYPSGSPTAMVSHPLGHVIAFSANSDYIGVMFDPLGTSQWSSPYGVPVATASPSVQGPPAFAVSDNNNGAILFFTDNRNGNTDIYAQQIDFSGNLGTGSVAPAAPTLSSPANSATAQSLTPSLSWNSVSGATSYRLQLASDAGFTSILKDTVTSDTSYSVYTSLSDYSNYYWKVKSLAAADSSAFSSAFTFRTLLATPAQSTPANGSIFASLTPSLTWGAVTGATTYEVEVAADTLFASIVETASGLAGTSYNVSAPLNYYTVYYWRLRATDGSETTSFSSRFSFRTLITTPVLSTPADDSVALPILTSFDWNDVTGATSYRLQIATDAAFTNVVQNITGISSSARTLTTPLDYFTYYYWRVSAFDGANQTAFSVSRRFQTELERPNLVSPAYLSPGNSIHPLLVWNTVDGAQDYRLQFASDAGFTTTLHDTVIADTTFYVEDILANNTLYYWRALAMNDDDTSGYSSSVFRTVVEVVPTLTHPINNNLVYSLSPLVYWAVSVPSTGISYDVQYSVDSTFPVALTTTLDAGSANNDTLSGLLPATHYFWRVRSKNATAIITYSSTEDFTTYGSVTTLPVASYPTGGVTVYSLSPALNWFLPGPSYNYTYDVRHKPSASGSWSAPVSVGSSLTYTLGGLTAGTSYDWQVRSMNGSDTSDWTSTNSFSTYNTSSASLDAPVISYPNGGVTVYSLVPTLTWYTGTSTAGLTFDLNLYTDTSAAAVLTLTGLTALSYQTSALTPGTTYYYKVRSDNGSTQSAWSSWASFTSFGVTGTLVPYLSYPVLGAVVYTNTATLHWYVVGSANTISYQLQLKANDTNFTSTTPVAVDSFVTGTLVAGTTYYWRVRSFNGSAYSAYTAIDSFYVTGSAGTLVPTLSWPVGGASSGTTVDLSWYVNGFAPTMSYQVLYSSEPDFSNSSTVNTSNLTTQLSGLVPGVIYYWKVRTYNGSVYSSFSVTETFVTNAGSAPVRPVAGSPVANVTLASNNAELSWFLPTAGTGLTYELQYSVTPDFSSPVSLTDITSTSKTITNLPAGSTVYWRVRSKTSNGNYSAYSVPGRFVPNTPTGVETENVIPAEFALEQNYPNPFNPSTVISFALPKEANVTIKVYDMLGREVKTLISDFKPAGKHSLLWNGISNTGEAVSAGTYLYRITAGEFTMTRKMVFLK